MDILGISCFYHDSAVCLVRDGDIIAAVQEERFSRRLKKIGLFNFLPPNLDPVKKFYEKINCDNFTWTKKDVGSCLDFIAICHK